MFTGIPKYFSNLFTSGYISYDTGEPQASKLAADQFSIGTTIPLLQVFDFRPHFRMRGPRKHVFLKTFYPPDTGRFTTGFPPFLETSQCRTSKLDPTRMTRGKISFDSNLVLFA